MWSLFVLKKPEVDASRGPSTSGTVSQMLWSLDFQTASMSKNDALGTPKTSIFESS